MKRHHANPHYTSQKYLKSSSKGVKRTVSFDIAKYFTFLYIRVHNCEITSSRENKHWWVALCHVRSVLIKQTVRAQVAHCLIVTGVYFMSPIALQTHLALDQSPARSAAAKWLFCFKRSSIYAYLKFSLRCLSMNNQGRDLDCLLEAGLKSTANSVSRNFSSTWRGDGIASHYLVEWCVDKQRRQCGTKSTEVVTNVETFDSTARYSVPWSHIVMKLEKMMKTTVYSDTAWLILMCEI